ncbi:DUF5615 family PIN-like protein [Chloroflexi bacterium TSY]|nr:DUF5615 family PIN-like protein [Chloroflexi bacterium TSY]
MKFLVDECCDTELVKALRSDGHDVLYVLEVMRGASDDEVLERAFSEQRFLLTEDKDFGELVYRLLRPAYGIILLRFDAAEDDLKISRLRYLLQHQSNYLSGSFVVLEADKFRVRPLASLH